MADDGTPADGSDDSGDNNENDSGNESGKNDSSGKPAPNGTERRRSSLVGLGNDVGDVIKRRSKHLSQDMTQALAGMSGHSLGDLANGQMPVQIDPYVEANTEVQELSADKSKIEEAFEKIDTEKNEDIELEEFVTGLRDILQVDLNELEIRELFGFMDSDDSNFISSTEWTMFLTQRYESKLLEKYKDAILSKILSNPHKRKHSNLVQGNDVEDWDPYELTKEQREMKEAMSNMLDPLVQELKVEDTLLEELHTHEQEDDFMNMDNVEKWTKWEVGSWLGDLKLDNYVISFLKAGIEGGTLLFDMPRDHMTHLGVGRVHQGKLERAINDLKKNRSEKWGLDECKQQEVTFYGMHIILDLDHKIVYNNLKWNYNKHMNDFENWRKNM